MSNGRIVLINEKFSDNVGDQAIHDLLKTHLSNLNLIVDSLDFSGRVSYSFVNSREVKSQRRLTPIALRRALYRSYWSCKNIKNAVLHFYNSDRVVIGGGQLLRDNGVFAWYFFFWTVTAKLFRNDIRVISVGTEGGHKSFDRILLWLSLRLVKSVSVRDEFSKRYLAKLYNGSITIVPDVVHLSPPVRTKLRDIDLLCFTAFEEIDSSYMNTSETSYIAMLREVFESVENPVLRCTTDKDFEFVKKVFPKQKVELFKEWREIDEYTAMSTSVYSTRMHPLIFAEKNSVGHVEGIEVNKKLFEFNSRIGIIDNKAIITGHIEEVLRF